MRFRRKVEVATDEEVLDRPVDELSSKELVQKATGLVVQAQNVLDRLNHVLDEEG